VDEEAAEEEHQTGTVLGLEEGPTNILWRTVAAKIM